MPNLIIENSALNIRVGHENSQQPNLVFQNKIIHMPTRNYLDFSSNYICGEDCDVLEGIYNVHYPIQKGKVEDWNSMEMIWKELMLKIGVVAINDNLSSHTFNDIYFLTSVNYTLDCYSHIMDFFFHNYAINKIGFELDAVNALNSTGHKSGIVVDSGDSLTKIVPILDGYADLKMIWQSELAGKSLSSKIRQHLITTLNDRVESQSSIDFLKENYFYHTLEGSNHDNSVDKIHLPDGTKVLLGPERYYFPDEIFDKASSEGMTFINGFFQAFDSLDRESKQMIAEKTLLVGGNTKIKNFEQKFLEEAKKTSNKLEIQLLKCVDPMAATFKGSSTNVFNLNKVSQSVTRQEFEESGSNVILHKKIPLLY